ncbi:MAG: hypothetical protein ACR2GR_02725 [Rhodothermales bacterium]
MHVRTYLLLFFVLALCPATSHAQHAVGPHLGYNTGPLGGGGEVFIGAAAHVNIASLPVVINPALDYYVGLNGVTLLQVDANALYPFEVNSEKFSPYAGGGLAISYVSVEGEDFGLSDFGIEIDNSYSNTDVGLNLVGGTFFNVGAIRPFAEARFTLGNGSALSLKSGVMFAF